MRGGGIGDWGVQAASRFTLSQRFVRSVESDRTVEYSFRLSVQCKV
jgi:hypothetical protein